MTSSQETEWVYSETQNSHTHTYLPTYFPMIHTGRRPSEPTWTVSLAKGKAAFVYNHHCRLVLLVLSFKACTSTHYFTDRTWCKGEMTRLSSTLSPTSTYPLRRHNCELAKTMHASLTNYTKNTIRKSPDIKALGALRPLAP